MTEAFFSSALAPCSSFFPPCKSWRLYIAILRRQKRERKGTESIRLFIEAQNGTHLAHSFSLRNELTTHSAFECGPREREKSVRQSCRTYKFHDRKFFAYTNLYILFFNVLYLKFSCRSFVVNAIFVAGREGISAHIYGEHVLKLTTELFQFLSSEFAFAGEHGSL